LESQTKSMYDRAPDELTLAHEVAHEWFGDSVTLARWKDIWVNEGFAEFSSWLWSEHTGQRSAQSFFDATYAKPASDAVWSPPPGDPGSGADIFSGSVYDRGAMTLQALRVKVGDAAFFALLRGWATSRAHGNATVQDFVAFASSTTGRDLGPFFQTWLFDSGKPTSW
ncbi:MAG: metallopeptidase, partial [Frankiales bacterium]|nr:metallopeptidase [Frankiales bacterium]